MEPDNVHLSGGAAMVTDFGVVKALSASSQAEHAGVTSLGVAIALISIQAEFDLSQGDSLHFPGNERNQQVDSVKHTPPVATIRSKRAQGH